MFIQQRAYQHMHAFGTYVMQKTPTESRVLHDRLCSTSMPFKGGALKEDARKSKYGSTQQTRCIAVQVS